MRYQEKLQTAYLLHSQRYRETSLLLELFTEHHGRVSLVARGARRPRSALRNFLEPFRKLLVSWSGKSELLTMTGAEEVTGPQPVLTGKALYCGFYLNELLHRLLYRGDPHPEVFTEYEHTLFALQSDASLEMTLRVFEKHLLELLGYGLLLDEEADTGKPLEPDCHYHYQIEHGPVPVGTAQSAGTITGRSLLALYEEKIDNDAVLKDCKLLMRHVLGYYLGDKPLKSRELLFNDY